MSCLLQSYGEGRAERLTSVKPECLVLGAAAVSDTETTPLDALLLQSLPQFQAGHREELLWGSYRSGLYLGGHLRLEFT